MTTRFENLRGRVKQGFKFSDSDSEMKRMIFVYVFALCIFTAGVHNLYAFFTLNGRPAGYVDFLHPVVVMGLLLIGLAAGLVRQRPLARTVALGLLWALLLLGFHDLFGYMVWGPGVFSGREFLRSVLEHYGVDVDQFLSSSTKVLVAGFFPMALSAIALFRIGTPYVEDIFGVDRWFGWQLRMGKLNLQVPLSALVIVGILNFGGQGESMEKSTLTAKDFGSPAKEAKGRSSNSREFPPALKSAVDPSTPSTPSASSSATRKVLYAGFTVDDRGIWIGLSAAELVYADLTTFKLKKIPFVNFQPSTEDFLSPTGTHFFSPEARRVIELKSDQPVASFGQTQLGNFLGFTRKGEFVIYSTSQSAIQIFDVNSAQARIQIPLGLKLTHEDVRWSADRRLLVFKLNDINFGFLNVDNGRYRKQKVEFRIPEAVFERVVSSDLVVSGPVEFTKQYKTYLVNSESLELSALQTKEKIFSMDPRGRSFLAGDESSFVALDPISLKNVVPWKMEFRSFVSIPRSSWFAVIEDGSDRVRLFDIDSSQRQDLPVAGTEGRKPDPRNCYLASSRDGQLLYTSCGEKAEVIWVSSLKSGQRQSWKFTLPF